MASQKVPKALIFDIGGVCVVSPLQAILDYETAHSIPKGYINYAISASKPNGAWHKAEKGEVPLDTQWFQAFKDDIRRPSTWQSYHERVLKQKSPSTIPDVDAEDLFWTMMKFAREPDPYMAPALRKLKASGRFRLVALSNTMIFPEGHPFNEKPPGDPRGNFDIFISSAHVGMRKPERNIYEYAMKAVQDKWPQEQIEVNDIAFLDDIGENLRMGRSMGWKTIKVLLGHTNEAVQELEKLTGLSLLDDGGKARL